MDCTALNGVSDRADGGSEVYNLSKKFNKFYFDGKSSEIFTKFPSKTIVLHQATLMAPANRFSAKALRSASSDRK